jgi:hypothetical protein
LWLKRMPSWTRVCSRHEQRKCSSLISRNVLPSNMVMLFMDALGYQRPERFLQGFRNQRSMLYSSSPTALTTPNRLISSHSHSWKSDIHCL